MGFRALPAVSTERPARQEEPRAYTSVVEDVEGRIGRHITGQGQEIPLDIRYEHLHSGKGWAMVKEIGAQARQGMFAAGIQAYISVRQIGPNNWTYVVGRMSPFVPFDCNRIYARMNVAEKGDGIRGEPPVGEWGGSDIIGGSPRINGSRLSPDLMKLLVEEALEMSPTPTPRRRRRYQSDRDPPMLPPRLKDWKKGHPQIGAFLRTEKGGTLQMTHHQATEAETLVVVALMRGLESVPEEALQPLLNFMQEVMKK